ncbi:MAG: DNA repair protein RadC [Bacteroidales bacterium]|nr:DNA repair protein RadC [Bacteroidales bacterium]
MHEGHRDRVKDRFLKEGLDTFEDHNIIEMLLFYALPLKDTNEIAHILLNRFGSLAAVFDAPFEDLIQIPGIKKNTALLIKLIPELSRKYMVDKSNIGERFENVDAAGQYILSRFIGKTNEMLLLICLDNKRKVLFSSMLFEGSINASQVSIRRIVETVVKYSATSVIIAHNHPSGFAFPSREDIQTTQKIKTSLEMIGATLLDHIIVSDDDFISLSQSGMLGAENQGI